MKTEASQDVQNFEKIRIRKQRSQEQFVFHQPHQSKSKFADKSHLQNNQQFPPLQINQDQQDALQEQPPQQILTQRFEYLKLPEIDEKFFIKSRFKPQVNLINVPKFKSHSHQPSRNEILIANENHFDSSHRKVEFNQNVQIIDYINNAYSIGDIDGSQKPIRQFRRQQTRFLKDELSKIPVEQRKRNVPELKREQFDFFDNDQVISHRNITTDNQF